MEGGWEVFVVEEKTFAEINVTSNIFNSLKEDYPNFNEWFQKKQVDKLFTVTIDHELSAVLYLKLEYNEQDNKINPKMNENKKLKIGIFKVQREGMGIGQEFMRIVLTKAKENHVDEIYLTVHDKCDSHKKFIFFIEKYGFNLYGHKGQEKVFVKSLI